MLFQHLGHLVVCFRDKGTLLVVAEHLCLSLVELGLCEAYLLETLIFQEQHTHGTAFIA